MLFVFSGSFGDAGQTRFGGSAEASDGLLPDAGDSSQPEATGTGAGAGSASAVT